jgi:predicted AAA+ superfamily ATPase
MRASYPIHPEFFDRLYDDWSTLERFQRTRGVLRLMAAVIHQLWQSGDASPLIMPGSLPLYAPRVRDELLRYLNDQWNAVLAEVDGEDAEAARIDNENQRFGQVQAARRLARAAFLGSVPYKATKGIEDVRIRLGVVQPGESISTYNDALGRLQQRLQFLYTSGQGRFWFDVQPNLTRTVADRSSRISDDDVYHHLEGRLKSKRLSREDFAGIHVCPESTDDVPDEPAARLVVLSPRQAHKRNTRESSALGQAEHMLNNRGNSPRRYRNMLLFAAADEDAVQMLLDETRRYLAWKSIQDDATALNLDRVQERQVKEAAENGNKTIDVQLDGAYQWAFAPRQEGTGPLEWEIVGLKSNDLGSTGGVVQRASYRLQSQGLLILNWSPVHLRTELNQYLWKDGRPHITVKQLWDYFATYPYLSRLRDRDVLLATIKAGVFTKDFFGYATGVTDGGGYIALTFGSPPPGVYYDDASVVVRPEIAEKQLKEQEKVAIVQVPGDTGKAVDVKPGVAPVGGVKLVAERATKPKRFYATVHLSPLRMSSEAGTIGQEVIQHLEALLGSNVEVTLEIAAQSPPDGFPDNVVRTVTENARTLKFENFAFEEE